MFLEKIFVVLFLLLLAGCGNTEYSEIQPGNKTAIGVTTSTKTVTIDLVPFSGMPQKEVDHVFAELLKLYPYVELKKAIPLPSSAFYDKRKRYRADSLIGFLKTITPEDHVTIGLTSKDISHTKGNIVDYGIMGLGFQPGPSCVVSTFRLNKNNLFAQLLKLAVHELGHTQGLPHCPEKTCFMRDAEGKNHTNEEKDFCPKCKTHLISRGWQLKS